MTQEDKNLLLIDLCASINTERWMSLEDYPNEVWRDIEGFDNRYMVSNLGRVKTKEFTYTLCGKTQVKPSHILRTIIRKDGYCKVNLGGYCKQRTLNLHRLVALAFIANPDNLPCINHKDENPTNNVVENLEWCDRDYNMQYGTWVSRNPRLRPVAQFSLDGKFIKEYKTIREASRETGIRHENIRNCAAKQIINKEKGYYTKSAGGYKWEFVDK